MRIISLKLGTPADGTIQLQCVQDVFALANAIYAPPPKTEWTSHHHPPRPSPSRLVLTAPYYEIAQQMGDNAAQNLADADAFLLVAAERPSNDAISASLWVSNDGSDYQERATLEFCPAGTLATAVGYLDTHITLVGTDLDLISANTHLQIDSGRNAEIVGVTAINGSVITVKRGCLDTLPRRHNNGARWWAWDGYAAVDEQTRLQGEQVSTAVTPATGQGVLALNQAPKDAITLTNRQVRPYPPANVQINHAYYPDTVADGDITLSWASRNRLQQTMGLIGWTEAHVTPEVGTEYRVVVNNGPATLIDERTNVTDYTLTQAITDASDETLKRYQAGDTLEIQLTTYRDNCASMQTYEHRVKVV